LGTTFNINAYSDETDVKTTLLEGKISFESDTSSRVLLPGQQLRFFQDQTAQSQTSTPSRIHSRTELYDDVDLEQAVAWTNDLFIFNSQHVTSIMRQISRWYDLDIKYDATFSSEKFSGIVSSKSNLSQVLKIMEEGGINFKLEGKTLTVF
jgi:ferric-dicitrate binding protein FerR (iron transport regulator)